MSTNRSNSATTKGAVSFDTEFSDAAIDEQQRAGKCSFVLVHGAWHGGWCWREVRDRLRKRGYDVYTPTLTGLGERQHLSGPHINLDTHIEDVLNVLIWEELSNVVLVGHSYAGMVITGVADRAPDWISSLVYVDAVLPEPRQPMLAVVPPELVERSRTKAVNGDLLPFESPGWFGIPEADRFQTDWMNRRLTPHPLATLVQPLEFSQNRWRGFPKTYVRCTNPGLDLGIDHVTETVSGDPNWTWIELETGHNAMMTAPNALTQIILDAAPQKKAVV